jgi:hypothetical protein
MTTSTALSPAQVYQLLVDAGYSHTAAITQTAIGMAESSLRPTAVGDVGLEDKTWGPSVGLFQERTLKAAPGQPGYNKFRDPNLLKTPEQQAAAAYATSSGGTHFTAWTTFLNGAYIKYLPEVSRAVNGSGGSAPPPTPAAASAPVATSSTGGAVSVQPASYDPFGVFSSLGADLKKLTFIGAGLALAVGLFVVGAWQASQPARDKAKPVVDAAKKAGETGAVAA